jgi:hypothetical protein
MNRGTRSHQSWRVTDARIRPEVVVAAAMLVAGLLVEVWQNARMAELCLALDHTRRELKAEQARLQFAQADLEHGGTRAALEPLAASLGLAPAAEDHVVILPADYLPRPTAPRSTEPTALALLDRVSRTLVSEATARAGH